MAESQILYKYKNSGNEIKLSLSDQRFTSYLERAGYNVEYAFNLYLYNARLAKSFLFPLHILEISLRNQISKIFENEFGKNWPSSENFRNILTKESLAVLDKGIQRAKPASVENIISTLTFDFWSNLFRSDYDRSLWQTRMKMLFPNYNITRHSFEKIVRRLNNFRNRIAHHEPIHKTNISIIHSNIINVIEWISAETANWVKHYSTVNNIIRTKPSAHLEPKPHLIDRADSDFIVVNNQKSLADIPAKRFIICKDNDGNIVSIIEKQQIANYLFSLAEQSNLIVDLSDHRVINVLEHQGIHGNFVSCGSNESLSKAPDLLKKHIFYLIVQDEHDLKGVIAKSHRRY